MKKSVQLVVPILMLCFASITVAAGIEGTITWNPATKQCSFNSGDGAHPHRNGLDKGDYMIWVATLPAGSYLEFLFIGKTVEGEQGTGASPFEDGKIYFDAVVMNPGQKIPRGPVRDVTGHFSYQISCRVGINSYTIDPMIDVPKSGISKETQTSTSN